MLFQLIINKAKAWASEGRKGREWERRECAMKGIIREGKGKLLWRISLTADSQ